MKPIKLESTYCIQVEIGDIPDFIALKNNKKTKYKNSFKNSNNVPSNSVNQDLFHIMRRCRRSQRQQNVLISNMSNPMRKRLFFRRQNKVKIAADLIAPVSIVSSPMLSYPLPNHLETYRKVRIASFYLSKVILFSSRRALNAVLILFHI